MTTTQQPRVRLSIDVPREARRRIHIAAAKRDQSRRRRAGQSIVTGIVRTIRHEMITVKMGELPASELRSVEDKLREILAL
jgi:hypothetical protein